MPDNRRQAESLSLSREVCWSRAPQVAPPQHRPLLHSASGPHTGLDTGATAASAKLTKLQELQDKKQTMDKILQELHSLRDQTLNNNSCKTVSSLYVVILCLWSSWYMDELLPSLFFQVVACLHGSVGVWEDLQIVLLLSALMGLWLPLLFILHSHNSRTAPTLQTSWGTQKNTHTQLEAVA